MTPDQFNKLVDSMASSLFDKMRKDLNLEIVRLLNEGADTELVEAATNKAVYLLSEIYETSVDFNDPSSFTK